jgi:hypothetical protein
MYRVALNFIFGTKSILDSHQSEGRNKQAVQGHIKSLRTNLGKKYMLPISPLFYSLNLLIS